MPDLDLVHPLLRMRDRWTFEDLQQLHVEEPRRFEILDGALVMSPSARLTEPFSIEIELNRLI